MTTEKENTEKYIQINEFGIDKEQSDGKYFLYSVINPKNILKTETFGIKIKRFENKEEIAIKKCDIMGKLDKNFDIYLGYTGHPHPIHPKLGQIENEKYRNEKLDKIMKNIHESEKKEFVDEDDDDDDEKINNEEQKENLYNESHTEFIFSNEDCLDEDKIIPEQRFAIISFATPELIHNLKKKLFKIRGYTDTYEKADKLSKHFENLDEGKFLIGIVEIGKWTPINLNTLKKMKTLDNKSQMEIMKHELNELNEIIGRYKKNLDSKKDLLEKRKMEQIKEAASNFEENKEILPEQNKEILPEQTKEEKEEIKELGKNKESTKERLQKTIEQIKKTKETSETSETQKNSEQQNKKQGVNLNNTNRDVNSRLDKMKKKLLEMKNKQSQNVSNVVDDKKVKISQEALRINEKKENLENLKADKQKLEDKLNKMKEMLNKKTL